MTVDSDMERSKSMAKALAPAYIRIGGPHSNSYMLERSLYPKEINAETGYTFSESQWVNVQQWAQQSGLDVVAVLAPQKPKSDRIGVRSSPWDPRNALDLISLSDHLGYNISWQLGYECQNRCDASGAELGRDVQRLRSMLNAFPRYTEKGIIIVGPDVVDFRSRQQQQYLQDYFSSAGATLGAVTWHPDFAGVTVESEGVSMHHDDLALERDSLYRIAGRNIYKKPLWIAESKPEECKRQFLGALVWARRLGNAAKLGIQVLMRQPDNSDLFRPTPDFWVSSLHKMLVGQQVLETRMIIGNRTNMHFYCQCTRPSSRYKKGSLTIFGVNLTPSRVTVNLKGLKPKTMHKYILMPGFDAPNRMFAETVLLNNEKLNLVSGKKVPDLQPAISNTERGVKLKLSSGGIGFWVLPDLGIKACMDVENGEKNSDSSEANEESISEEDESKEVFDIISSAEEEQHSVRQHQPHRKRQSVHHSSTNRHRVDEAERRRSHKLGNQAHADPDHYDKVLHKRDQHAVSSKETDTGKVIEALTLITEVENAMKNLERLDRFREYKPSTSELTSTTDNASDGRSNSAASDNDKLLSKVLNTAESRRTVIPSKIEDKLHALYELLSEEKFGRERSSSFRHRRNLIGDSEIDSTSPSTDSIIFQKNSKEYQNPEEGVQRKLYVMTEPLRVERNENGETIKYRRNPESQQAESYIDRSQSSEYSQGSIDLEGSGISDGPNYIQLLKQSDSTVNSSDDVPAQTLNENSEKNESYQSVTDQVMATSASPNMNEAINHNTKAEISPDAPDGIGSDSVRSQLIESADQIVVEDATQDQTVDQRMAPEGKLHKVDVSREESKQLYRPPTQPPQPVQHQHNQESTHLSQSSPYSQQQPTPIVDSLLVRRLSPKPYVPYYSEVEKSEQKVRAKRHINNLEDIFHREMVAQDDNNLRDCQCRVIRGQQECKECNMLRNGIYNKPSAFLGRRCYKHSLMNKYTNRMRFRRNVDVQSGEFSGTVTSEASLPEEQVGRIVEGNFEGQQEVSYEAHDSHPTDQIEVVEDQEEVTGVYSVTDPRDSITPPSPTQEPEIAIVDDRSGVLELEDGNSEVTPNRLPRRTSPQVKIPRNRKQSTKSNDTTIQTFSDVSQNMTAQDQSINTDSNIMQTTTENTASDIGAGRGTRTSPSENVVVNLPKPVDQAAMDVSVGDSTKSQVASSLKDTNSDSDGAQRFDLNNKFRNSVHTKDKNQKKNDKIIGPRKPPTAEKIISPRKPPTPEKTTDRNSIVVHQNNTTGSGSLHVTETGTNDTATKDEDSVKSRQARLTTRAEALAALRREVEKRRTKKMIEASLRQLDTESARFAEYQKRRQDQIEKLKARLRAKREKMLQQYKQELLEAIEKSSDSEERSLRRRDLLQILKENMEKDGLEPNSEKSSQILNYRPNGYGTNRDARESEKATPTTDDADSRAESTGESTGKNENTSFSPGDQPRYTKVLIVRHGQVPRSSLEKRSLNPLQTNDTNDRKAQITPAHDVNKYLSLNEQQQNQQHSSYDTSSQSETKQKRPEQGSNHDDESVSVQMHNIQHQGDELPTHPTGHLHLYQRLDSHNTASMKTIDYHNQNEKFNENIDQDSVPSIYNIDKNSSYDLSNPKPKRSSTGVLGMNSYPFVGESEPDQNLQGLYLEPSAQILARSYRQEPNQYNDRKKREALPSKEDIGGPLSFSLTLDESEMKSPVHSQYDGLVRKKRDTQDTYGKREDSAEQLSGYMHKSVKKSLHNSKKSSRISRRPRSVGIITPSLEKPKSHIMFLGPRTTSTLSTKINTVPGRPHVINQRNAQVPHPKKCKRSCQNSMENEVRSTENNEINRSTDPDMDEILNDIFEMKANSRLLEEFDERKAEVMKDLKNSQQNLQEYLQSTKNSSVETQPKATPTSIMSTTKADIETIFVETIPKLQTVVTGELEKAKNLTGSLEDFLQTFDDQYSDTTEDSKNSSSTVANDGRVSHYVFKSMVDGVNKIFGIVSKFAKILQAH